MWDPVCGLCLPAGYSTAHWEFLAVLLWSEAADKQRAEQVLEPADSSVQRVLFAYITVSMSKP